MKSKADAGLYVLLIVFATLSMGSHRRRSHCEGFMRPLCPHAVRHQGVGETLRVRKEGTAAAGF